MNNWSGLSFIFFMIMSALFYSHDLYGQKKPKGMVKIKGGPPENFDVFYSRFHQDSIFQLSRLKDPLLGMKKINGQETPWTLDNWDYMTTKIQDFDASHYKTKTKRKKKYFEQEIWSENLEYHAAYRFELHGSKWYLVFAYKEDSSND
ncbi:hypothetical protein [Shivajiella indica]|uniref:DUF4348 domain-containing protein n=1 Tax=Shivajiella indica TaxID=872115 RepID=A0ABW5BAQ2_9BACT